MCSPSIVFDGIFLDISPQKSKNYWLLVLTPLLLTVTKGEFTKTSIFFGKILRSKLYYAIVLSKEFHLNGNTIWFKRKNDIPSGKLEDKNCTIVSVCMVIWVTGRQWRSARMTSKWLICNFCLSFVIFLILMTKDRQTWHFDNKSQTKVRNLVMLIPVCLSEFRVYKY